MAEDTFTGVPWLLSMKNEDKVVYIWRIDLRLACIGMNRYWSLHLRWIGNGNRIGIGIEHYGVRTVLVRLGRLGWIGTSDRYPLSYHT